MSYDVFLSYRREAGSAEARVLQSSLQARGKQCFLDATEMVADGSTLLQQIQQIPNFLVILHSGALDQCADPQDWLRQEIGYALRNGRKIIPVMLPGFVYPQNLPEDVRALMAYQGIEYNLRAFEPMLAGIVSSINSAQVAPPQQASSPQQVAQPQYFAAAPPPMTPAFAPVVASASFNWMLAGLLFLAEWLPTIPLSVVGSSGVIFRTLGYSLGESLLVALGTTIIWQMVRNPVAIPALCGLNHLVTSYFLGILFFSSFRMYGLGILSFLFGALVTGTIGLARVPGIPHWALLAGPMAGTAVYAAVGIMAVVPGFGLEWRMLVLPVSAAMIGAAFFFAIRPEEVGNAAIRT